MVQEVVVTPEDARIIEYVKTHDPNVLAQILEENLPWIKHAVARVNPSFPVLDQDDLVQSGVLGFLGALNRFDPSKGVPFKAWALVRVRGAAIDAVRKVSSTARTRNIQMISLSDGYASDEGDLSDMMVPEAASPALRDAILDLPILQGAILLLSIHGLPAAQIGLLVNRSERGVHQERNAALETLRNTLTDKLGEFV